MSDLNATTYKIAIVDDHEPVRAALGSLLRSYGHTAVGFDSAEALLALATLDGYDCVVTDLQMPGIGGLELQERLRGAGRSVPLIVMTAFPEEALRKRALQGGAICFLTKPLDVEHLLRCLGAALAPPGAPAPSPAVPPLP